MRLLAALLLLFLASSGAVAQEPSRVIESRVVRASNGAALARARVVVALSGRAVETVLTDVHGRFSVTVPPDGIATLTCTKAGFSPVSLPLRRGSTLVAVPDEIAMEPGSAISGRVVDGSGAPALAARVTVARLDGEIPGRSLPLEIETDDRGEYRVGSLPQGRYRVSALLGTPFNAVRTSIGRFRVDRIMRTTATELVMAGGGAGGPPELPATVPRVAIELEPGRTASARDLELPSPQAFAPAMPEARAGGGIRGYVRTPTGQPTPNVQVRLMPRPYSVSGVARTKADGSYELFSVPAGEYAIEAHKDGQDPSMLAPSVQRRPPVPIVVGDGVIDVDLILPRGGAIEGTVVDDQGDPMEGVTVAALLLTRNGDRVVASLTGRERITDDRGHYRLFELPPGEYVVVADANAEPSGLDRRTRVGVARVFHPSEHEINAAARVVLPMDGDVAGVDIEYALTPAARVTGRARDSRGEPVEGFALLAPRSRLAGAADEPRFAPLGKDGAFAITNVAPGDYALQVIAEGGMGRAAEFAARLITVDEADPAPLAIRTAPRASVRGRVVIERPRGDGPGQPPAAPFAFRALSVDPDVSPSFEDGRVQVIMSSNGTFELNGLVGPARVAVVALPNGWYAKALNIGRADVLLAPFDFGTAGQVFTGATLVLSSRGAVIEGRVTPPRGGPVPDAIVLAFSTDRTWWGEPSQYVKAVRTGQRGEFRIAGLPPGEYLVAATDAIETSVDFNQPGAEFLQRLASRARRVEVDEGDTRTIVVP